MSTGSDLTIATVTDKLVTTGGHMNLSVQGDLNIFSSAVKATEKFNLSVDDALEVTVSKNVILSVD